MADERPDALKRAASLGRDAFDRVRERPVSGHVRREDVRAWIATRFDLVQGGKGGGDAAVGAVEGVAEGLGRFRVDVTHPRYFGLFNPSVLPAAAAAGSLVASMNPQLAAWGHGPAACEMEQTALETLAGLFPLADGDAAPTNGAWLPGAFGAHFTSGGQEANTTALVVALTAKFPEVRDGGVRAAPVQPVLFVSAEGHHSFEKAAHATGLGRNAVRRVPVDAKLRMDVRALDAAIRALPPQEQALLVVGTAGTTSSGAIDPLPDIAALCEKRGLWFHCDAAWGGGALLSPKLRPRLAGIARADSVTWDAHKWLQVPFGAGMYFTRHREALPAAFSTASAYMPQRTAADDAPDSYDVSLQWSRRSAGLPLFAALAAHGLRGYAEIVDEMTRIGDVLRTKLLAAKFQVVNDTPLPLVNISHPKIESGAVSTGDVARVLHRRGRAWVSPTTLSIPGKQTVPATEGRKVLRACITSHRTTEADLDVLVSELRNAVGG